MRQLAGPILCFCLLAGCATPGVENAKFARQQKWISHLLHGSGGLPHQVYVSAGAGSAVWHVYIEGDGRPWIQHRYVAADPTVAVPLMMRLAALDSSSFIYLGRPCYSLPRLSAECYPKLWTQARYSARVVDSMVAVLHSLIRRYGIQRIILIGHSGGGALAVLMAPRVKQVEAVVTLAGNLDLAAWTRKHGYSPLEESLDPIRQPPLPALIQQWHIWGMQDRNIPLRAIERYAARQKRATLKVCINCSHAEGWESFWPDLLQLMAVRLHWSANP